MQMHAVAGENYLWGAERIRGELLKLGIAVSKLLLRDNDGKFTAAFDAIALGAGIRVIRTPVLAPKAVLLLSRDHLRHYRHAA